MQIKKICFATLNFLLRITENPMFVKTSMMVFFDRSFLEEATCVHVHPHKKSVDHNMKHIEHHGRNNYNSIGAPRNGDMIS
jgi:hypothetical protein